MSEQEKSALELVEDSLKGYWRKRGNPHIIVGRHSEFVVEPRMFMGKKLNPEIERLLIKNYLASAAAGDSGMGKVVVKSNKLLIKDQHGKTVVTVSDRKLIKEYLAQRA